MTVEQFERLLKATMGLEPASVGTSAVRRALQARMLATGAEGLEQYWANVAASRTELQALVEEVVVPETWFFRDAQAFAAMARLAMEDAPRRRAADAKLRVLSLPCSTGEEPYSIAMALFDAGLHSDAFRIDAVDISHANLDHARRAVYGRNSFRGNDLAYRDRHFVAHERGHALLEPFRLAVTFRQGNLFAAGEIDGGPYDMIFCRNLLIYFDAADQRRAIGILRQLLTPDGVLFVGHSESSIAIDNGFTSIRVPFSFAFRKTGPHLARPPMATIAVQPATPRAVWKPPVIATTRPTVPAVSPATAVPMVPRHARDADTGLDAIREAADRADFPTAIRLGEAYLRARPESPDALRLMGVVSDAAGDADAAARYYRKTLYLKPNDPEALAHLALLLERQGNASGAQLIRERARRLRELSGA